MIPEETRRVVQACRALAAAGQQDMVWGHLAIRDSEHRGVWIKRSGVGYDELRESDIQLIDWNRQLVHGDGETHIEAHIHLEIMRARADVNASVHSHAPSVNSFAALEEPLRAISHEGTLFAEPQVPRTALSGDLIASAERGRELARDLGKSRACLMPRHGFVAVGGAESEAVMTSVLLEGACRAYLDARAAGDIRSYSDSDEIREKTAHVWPSAQFEAGYAYLLRRARRLGFAEVDTP